MLLVPCTGLYRKSIATSFVFFYCLEEDKEATTEAGDIKTENVETTEDTKKKLDNGADNSAASGK